MSGSLAVAALVSAVLAGSGQAFAQATASRAQDLLAQARAAWQHRDAAQSAARALDLYGQAIAAGGGYDALWEGARAAAEMGESRLPESAGDSDRIKVFRRGVEWAKAAAALQPARVEGHLFWAVNLGEAIDRQSFVRKATSAGELRREAELAVKYDAEFECGLPLVILGSFLAKAPSAFGGDHPRGLALLQRAVRVCPDAVENHLRLAYGLEAAGDRTQAIAEFEWVLAHEPTEAIARANYPHQRREAERHLAALRKAR